MSYRIRLATPADLPALLHLAAASRGIMERSGNPHQWAGGFPPESVLRQDIASGQACLIEDEADSAPAGAFIWGPGPDASYARIDGAWLDDVAPYHVVHRLLSVPEKKGIFAAMLRYCFARTGNLRADTHADNRIVQHLLAKHGFTYCGVIQLADGRGARLAYQKIITPPHA